MQYSNVIYRYFTLDKSLKQRDVTSIKKMVSTMMEIIYPNGITGKGEISEILEFATEMRFEVKEQLKCIQSDREFSGARFIIRIMKRRRREKYLFQSANY